MTTVSFYVTIYQQSSVLEEVTVLEGVLLVASLHGIDVSLPSLTAVVVAAVVAMHRMLLASSTHCDMNVPLDRVHSMNMKPMKNKTSLTDAQSDHNHQCHCCQ